MTAFVSCAGSIFDSKAAALVNPCNCRGVSGAGLAKQFAERFPQHQTRYTEICAVGEMRLGEPVIVEDATRMVVYFPTKDHWREHSDLDSIRRGVASLAVLLATVGASRVAVPMLGCGLGQLRWVDVRPVVVDGLSLAGDALTVELYETPA